MKMVRKIKMRMFRFSCRHDFERLAFYRVANKGVYRCTKCNKRKEVEY